MLATDPADYHESPHTDDTAALKTQSAIDGLQNAKCTKHTLTEASCHFYDAHILLRGITFGA